MTRQQIIVRRRAFRSPGFVTLAAVGMEGDWVSPIQKMSGSPIGAVLVGKHWFDSAAAARALSSILSAPLCPILRLNRYGCSA